MHSFSDVAELARLLLTHDRTVAAAFVQVICQQGAPLERVCRELLAPTARRIRDLREQDECDLKELTVGLGRFQAVLREVSTAV